MTYHGRRAASVENESLRVTVLREGGHIAEILDKASGVNPLWTPPWPGIEPSTFGAVPRPEYGGGIDAPLLAAIMGHNLCLDLFGIPSAEESAAGMGVHGEAPVAAYEIEAAGSRLRMYTHLPLAMIRFERTIALDGSALTIHESIESLAGFDRPIHWTQHVTLGPPFLECGVTRFETSARRSKTFEGAFGAHDYLRPNTEFDWPLAPRIGGGAADLSLFSAAPASSAYTAHLMDPNREDAFFRATHTGSGLTFFYSWKRADFPWLGRWEESRSRTAPPWNGKTIACGMEFGASPMPETRRQSVERGRLFGEPTYRWLGARERISVEYRAGFESLHLENAEGKR